MAGSGNSNMMHGLERSVLAVVLTRSHSKVV